MSNKLRQLLAAPAEEVAPRLLGSLLVRELDGVVLIGRIVETEAYDQLDAASHSYHGRTPRTEVMFGPPGHLYVYFTYGMHYCCNVVTSPEGHGSAVLIRALEPLHGQTSMEARRRRGGLELTNGPAKLCQALEIDKRLNGHDLQLVPLQLRIEPPAVQSAIIQTTRIGISQAQDKPWRFYLKHNACISKT